MKARHALVPVLVAAFLHLAGSEAAPAGRFLWEIGTPDNNNREFALAPSRYSEYREDGFFVVGQSDPKQDWPYVHPGPGDGWAAGRKHTATIAFGLKGVSGAGECALHLDLLDTHSQSPPELRIRVNGAPVQPETSQPGFRLPRGAGDDSVFGQTAKGREHQLVVRFPAKLLRAGANEITITTENGSWVLYDWIGFEGPPGLGLAPVTGTMIGSVQSPPVLVEHNALLTQPIKVTLRHFGEPQEADLRVDERLKQTLRLARGQQSIEFAAPAVDKETRLGVSVEVAGKTLASQTVTLKPVRKWVVYLLPHSHVDIGYTHVQTDVERAQWRFLEMAMDTARKTATNPPGARFKWNVEVLWAIDSYLQQASPEQRAAFFAAVKSGQVGLDALYGNMLTGLCRPEEFLRQLRMATEMTRISGVPVESAMITDVPGYTWGVVPAFAQSGVKYFSIGPNGGDRIGHTAAAWGDKPFWWIGPNGLDKVLVWMTGTGYYQVYQSAEKLLEYLGRLEAKGYGYDFVQVRHCLGDNGEPDVGFADKVKAWNETHAYPRLVIATTAEMFRDFEQRYGNEIPTAKGDFTPYWEDGAASSARETALNRASADRLVQAETLFAMVNPKAYPLRDFYQAWRNVVLYDEHTWGAHNSISQPDAPFVKSQWAIKQQFALDADQQSRRLIEAANSSRGEAARPPSERMNMIDVFNTTGYSYAYGLVVVPKELSLAGDGVAYVPTNKAAAVSQRLTSGELIFRPCLGSMVARRFYINDDKPALGAFKGVQAQGTTLTSAKSAVEAGLTLRLDEKTGAIASLVYRGFELVNTNAATGLNDYFYLPGSDLKGLQRNGPVKISVKEKGPLIASLLVESEAPGCRKLTREYRLHALRNYVEVINTVDKLPVRTKEGVHFGFGFNVPGGAMRMDVPWGVVRPETDQLPGACRNWFSVQRWVDISSKDYGITWLTPDAPLVEIGGITANLIGSLSDPRAWMDRIEPSQTVYSWAMNNHWHTNYRAEQEGPTVFRYFIWPHDGSHRDDRAARVALECNQPLLVLPARGEEPKPAPLRVSGAGIQVTAFKPSDDGKGWIVRLFGYSDKTEKASLHWNEKQPGSVWISDNSERPLNPVEGSVEVPSATIVTLRADFAK